MPAIRLASFDSSIFQQPVEAQVRTLADMLMRYRRELEYLLNGQLDEDNGLVSADVVITNTLVTNTLYAEYGRIANLTVSELNTAWKKITNYLAADTSPVGYLHMYEQYAKWIIASTDGSATVQETDYDENPLYWIDETHTGMTTTVNAFPVLTYVYTEYVKREISFINIDGNDIPVELIGTGTGTGNNGKGVIYKEFANSKNTMHVGYYHSTSGSEIGLTIDDDGIHMAGILPGTDTDGTYVQNLYVETAMPANAPDKSVLVDTDDYSRYDRQEVTASATVTSASSEFIELTGTTAAQTLTITSPGATAGVCLKYIKNSSNQTWTIGATVDGSASPTIGAGLSVVLLWNNTDWRKVADYAFGLDTVPVMTSAEFAGKISNETGTGLVVFNANPTITTPVFGDATNNTHIESDGTLVFAGTGTVYNDINTGINPRNVGANRPTLAAFLGNIYEFQFAVGNYADMTPIEFLHGWKEGTAVEIHVHWATGGLNDGTVRGVKWEVEYTYAAMGTGVFTANAATSAETSIAANEVALTHKYTSIVTFTPSVTIGAQLCIRLSRIASVTNTAPAADPFLLSFGVHYQIDTVGSRSTSAK